MIAPSLRPIVTASASGLRRTVRGDLDHEERDAYMLHLPP